MLDAVTVIVVPVDPEKRMPVLGTTPSRNSSLFGSEREWWIFLP
jgi:hypothetical protein